MAPAKIANGCPSRQSSRTLSRALVADARRRMAFRKARSARILAELKAAKADPDFDRFVLDVQQQEIQTGLDEESRHYDGLAEFSQKLDRRVA